MLYYPFRLDLFSQNRGAKSKIQFNKYNNILVAISFVVLSTSIISCSSSHKAMKKCRECPEFSINNEKDYSSELTYFNHDVFTSSPSN